MKKKRKTIIESGLELPPITTGSRKKARKNFAADPIAVQTCTAIHTKVSTRWRERERERERAADGVSDLAFQATLEERQREEIISLYAVCKDGREGVMQAPAAAVASATFKQQ